MKLNFVQFIFLSLMTSSFNCEFCDDPDATIIQQSFSYSNLSFIPSVYQPLTLYETIDVMNIENSIIPDGIFANICVKSISLVQGHITNISDQSFADVSYLEALKISKQKFTSLNGLIDGLQISTLQKLELSFNQIKQIDQEFTSSFSNLINLYLNNNNIEFIADFAFKNLINLRFLYLQFNRLKSISKQTLFGIEALYLINLESNFLDYIDEIAFDNHPQLDTIILKKNFLKTIRSQFQSLPKLGRLDLQSNLISEFDPEAFINLTLLNSLDLSGNKFNHSSVRFDGLVNLQNLQISNVKLNRLSDKFLSGLQRVSSIFIRQCKLETIDSHVFANLTYLKTLGLSNNKLSTLENELFQRVKQLNTLQLDFNIISQIDTKVFTSLASLTKLDISHNLLTNISIDLFADLKNLRYLYLSFNRLKLLKTGLFKNLPELLQLKIDANRIDTIERGAFDHVPKLNLLDLSSNKLKILKAAFFVGLESLTELRLNGNRLTGIESESFKGLSKLDKLDLSDNFLISLEAAAFSSLSCLLVNLNQNQLDEIKPRVFLNSTIGNLLIAKNTFKSLEKNSFCFLNGTSLIDWSFNKLASISSNLFCDDKSSSAIEKFYLGHNFLVDLSFLKSQQLWNLKELDVSANLIEWLYTSDFEHLTKLRVLFLRDNPIRSIKEVIFSRMDLDNLNIVNISAIINISGIKLKAIDLSDNQLAGDLGFLNNQSHLEQLCMRNVGLNFTLVNFSALTTLNTLDLSSNMDDNNFTFHDLISLKWLSLTQMGLTSLKRFELNSLVKLEYLNVSDNSIEKIDKFEIGCRSLTKLDLSSNKIVWLHQHAFESMENLQFLYLDSNRIKDISIYIKSGMSYFSARENQEASNFDILQNSPISSTLLTKLDLSFNSLNSSIDFTSIVDSGITLREVYLNANRLTSIATSLLRVFSSMMILNLESNLIDSIESTAFQNLDQLTYLYLANNCISSLENTIFSSLTQLKSLNLSTNRLTHVNKHLFENLFNLEILDLSFNQVKSIEGSSLINQAVVHSLYLNGNHDLIISFDSLNGLESIQDVFISFKVLTSYANKESLKASLKPVRENTINDVAFHRTINLIYDYRLDFQVNCTLVLEFLSKNIQINLKTDYELSIFLLFCQSLEFY